MSNETMMTDAATTTEGAAASPTTAEVSSPAVAQQAEGTLVTSDQQQTADQKTSSDSTLTPDGKDAKDGKSQDAAKQTAPEKYEDFTIMEGATVDPEVTDSIKTVAKELNLSQAQAQKLADLAAERSKVIGGKQAEVLQKARVEWGEAAKSDKEFGGDKLNENLSVAKKGLDTFGTPELRKVLNESGLGNHPEFIRFFYRAGKAISEDRFVSSGGSAPKGSRDAAKNLYPNQPQT
ncbi:putative protease [uncultured Caudovirales phage]|uniref:Putative protease n=1 Tax=uncultured Caudovirales phage TaxID=2100421 RepID=A0A6J5KRK4_9CAUD|nr:putative protease [uncultured Caudovirales phage]